MATSYQDLQTRIRLLLCCRRFLTLAGYSDMMWWRMSSGRMTLCFDIETANVVGCVGKTQRKFCQTRNCIALERLGLRQVDQAFRSEALSFPVFTFTARNESFLRHKRWQVRHALKKIYLDAVFIDFICLADRRATNKYYPPDWDPSKVACSSPFLCRSISYRYHCVGGFHQ